MVALVVGEQHLAAPDGAVGAVAGAVEREPDHLLAPSRPCSAITAAMCAWWCCTDAHRPARGIAVRPRGGAVARVRVGDHDVPGATPVRCSRCRSARVERRQRGQVVHVADVLAQPGVPALARPRRCSSGRRRRPASAARRPAARPAAARSRASGGPAARAPSTTRTTESSHGTWIGRSWQQPAVGERRQPVQPRRRRRKRSARRRGCPRSSPGRRARPSPGSPNSSACSGV